MMKAVNDLILKKTKNLTKSLQYSIRSMLFRNLIEYLKVCGYRESNKKEDSKCHVKSFQHKSLKEKFPLCNHSITFKKTCLYKVYKNNSNNQPQI